MEDDSTEWVIIATFSGRMEAEIARALLESHGVQAQVMADDVGGLRPDLASVQGAHLVVPSHDVHVAKRLLEEPPDESGGEPSDTGPR